MSYFNFGKSLTENSFPQSTDCDQESLTFPNISTYLGCCFPKNSSACLQKMNVFSKSIRFLRTVVSFYQYSIKMSQQNYK